jgi:hypothetical protein
MSKSTRSAQANRIGDKSVDDLVDEFERGWMDSEGFKRGVDVLKREGK